ncbi:lipoprotein [Bordetella ansorpii]|uniref:Lipoprotein n=1 Tax=Bordetella ansorpii TaxID=288768 RepID=A0A157RCW6_9BORD|nr:hypothetical protein [Bordetella ansorpii]SAI55189.1 lipoprotein [Bordetella ansorpii]
MAGKWIAASMAAWALAGCSVGMEPGGGALSGSFDANVSLRQAVQSARQQAEMCLVGDGGYAVASNLDDAARRGEVRITGKLTSSDVATVALTAIDGGRTRATVNMWGRGIWDETAMRAMHDAILFGTPSCTSYMPRDKGSDPNAWFTRRQ